MAKKETNINNINNDMSVLFSNLKGIIQISDINSVRLSGSNAIYWHLKSGESFELIFPNDRIAKKVLINTLYYLNKCAVKKDWIVIFSESVCLLSQLPIDDLVSYTNALDIVNVNMYDILSNYLNTYNAEIDLG